MSTIDEDLKSSINVSVFALFKTKSLTEAAYELLKESGFRSSDISAFMPEPKMKKSFVHEIRRRTAEGMSAGVLLGILLGGSMGITGLVGNLDSHSFVALGDTTAIVLGIGLGSAFGGLFGAIIGSTQSIFIAKRYDAHIDDEGILMSVHCDTATWTKKAKELLKKSGARNIVVTSEAKTYQ